MIYILVSLALLAVAGFLFVRSRRAGGAASEPTGGTGGGGGISPNMPSLD
ncbi:hypothetical protein [Novosphingobium lindaniclasticum]|uniref:Uncharacterized protein n=1 Tax=Novosphingobium lindaniclasticum LE124 TaxID=1096930 RepID=T0ISN0_9SPHN|nr:hypothetical protein [Novosphingobium lindaniclasticum]EQB12684.1 hypothetical protein L284_15025 [Novosphingobium lindaniclasticum LE124]